MRHVIADARLRDDEVWVECQCGAIVTGDNAERVNEPFQRHRVTSGLHRGEVLTRRVDSSGTWRDFKSLQA